MKKVNIYLISLAMMAFSCSKEFSSDEYGGYEMLTDYMLKEYQVGAALRTITESGSYRFFDPGNSLWSATLETHDHESGGLTESVDWYVSNGGNNEVLARTVSRSEMYDGPVGLPRMDISMSLVEAGGLVGGYQGGNTIIHRMVLKLTDGRTFSTESVSGSLTQSYFKSPFQYRKTITCFMDAGIVTAVPGLYTVNMTDSWGDGWNGAAVVMTLDGVDYSTSFSTGSADTIVFEVPTGSATMGFKFVAGAWDSEVDFNIVYSKLDGSNSQTALPNVGASPPTGYYALSVCQ
ncbi:MAG: hypothetical protein ABGW56_02710 [Flavobacteriaceae bacterium]|jgi:hypothetical protein|nr:hypothetical protein [Alphaproteobacteria bacterium]